MAGKERVELPDEIDRLLDQALSVEPSPAFLPRVRQRIGREPAPSFRWWRLFAPAAAATATLAAVASIAVGPEPVSPPAAPGRPALPTLEATVRPTSPDVVEPLAPPRVPRRSAGAPSGSPRAIEPVVMVDERQRAAVGTLMRLVAQGRLNGDAFALTVAPSAAPVAESVVPIGVPPLEVSPVAAGGVLQPGTGK